MSPTGPLYAGTAVSGSGSDGAWTNPGNATGPANASYASGNISTGGSRTNQLLLSNFGFNIPTTAIIDGIVVEFDRYGSNAQTLSIQLLKAGVAAGVSHGNDYSDGWPPTTPSYVSYGGSADLWSTTWTPSDINNTNFGVAIAALNSHGGGSAFIDAVRITVYWHTTPGRIPVAKSYLYKVFDSITGTYLGNLPNVSTDFAFAQDINTTGVQISVTCGVSADTSGLAPSPVLDETGAVVLDEAGNIVTDESATPYSGIGTGTALIRDGNRVEVWEYGYYHPNGICMFKGIIERHEDSFGGEGSDNGINLTIYSDGQDLDNYLILSQPAADQSQLLSDSVYPLNFASNYPPLGQVIIPGGGVNGVARIRLKIAAVTGNNPIVTVSLFASASGLVNISRALSGNTAPSSTAQQVVSSTTAQTYDFTFNFPFPSTFSGYYAIVVSCADVHGVNVSYQSTAVYSGSIFSPTVTTGALYFTTYQSANSTNPLYSDIDPSNMFLSFLDNYGGKMNASGLTVQGGGLPINYQFNTATLRNGIESARILAPDGFYYYADLGTDLIYFQSANTAADFVLTKGVHIADLTVVSTIEQVVNACYVIGGTSSDGTQVYTYDFDQDSINRYGLRSTLHNDTNIIDTATAHIVGKNIISESKDEQYQTVVTVLDLTMDITLLTPGKVIGFNGFASYVDGLLCQIVRREYTPSSVKLTLGILPKRTTLDIQQVTRSLIELSTISNPATPA